ncbi:MAG: uncharacterized protein PWQ41_534 [Bacillota bacterium]|jgi:hypothetical protein|nr:uncharacterized protein [Bacillota bacterium]MDK2924760.1 uncharacterized protein [Bacillota bacterium]
MKATNFTRKKVLAEEVKTAFSFAERLVGLICTAEFRTGMGLLLAPCSSIHTWFMRYPIDVIFLNREDRVLKVAHSVPPFRFGPVVRGAAKALELPAGVCRATGTEIGDVIEFTCEE